MIGGVTWFLVVQAPNSQFGPGSGIGTSPGQSSHVGPHGIVGGPPQEQNVPDDHPAATVQADVGQLPLLTRRVVSQRRCRVVSQVGAPVGGARVTWTPVLEEWLSSSPAWPSMDWAMLGSISLSSFTEADGSLQILAIPDPPAISQSIIWITHPDYVAQAIQIDHPVGVAAMPSTIVLDPAPRLEALVVDGQGAPVPGATIVQFPDLTDVPDSASPPDLVLRRTSVTNSRGYALLDPFPDRQRIHAEAHALVSTAWIGRQPASITLILTPTASAQGVVRVPPQRVIRPGDHVSIRKRVGGDETLVARGSVRRDGGWGPICLPLSEAQEYLFRLEAHGLIPSTVRRPPPAPGERVNVDFDPQCGLELPFHISDPQKDPIEDALIRLYWEAEGGHWEIVHKKTDSRGIALYSCVPPGRVWIRVRRQGFVHELRGPIEILGDNPQPYELTLQPAGLLQGRCEHKGQPVADFTLLYWSGSPSKATSLPILGSHDGSFTVDDAPLGELFVSAFSRDYVRCEPVLVVLERDVPSTVLLELPAPLSGRGQVVSGTTNEPVPGAVIRIYAAQGRIGMKPWGPDHITNTEGRFEVAGFAPGWNVLEISAPGYARQFRSRASQTGEDLDWGVVTLAEELSLLVRFLHEDSFDPTICRASVHSAVPMPDKALGPDGTARFAGLAPGFCTVDVVLPDYRQYGGSITLQPGRDSLIEIDGRRRHPLRVRVVPEPGTVVPDPLALGVYFECDSILGGYRQYPISDSLQVDVDPVLCDRLVLSVIHSGEVIAIDNVDVRLLEGRHVDLPLLSRSKTIQIVDELGTAVHGASVFLFLAGGETGWTTKGMTDSNGRFTASQLPSNSLGALVSGPSGRVQVFEQVELGPSVSDPVILRLAPDATVEVQFLDHDFQMSGLRAELRRIGQTAGALDLLEADSQGIARSTDLSEGDYEVLVAQPGVWLSLHRVRALRVPALAQVQVRRRGSLRVQTTGMGLPLTGCSLQLHSIEFGTTVASWANEGLVHSTPSGLITDDLGRLRIDGLPHGDYRWEALTPDGTPTGGLITVRPQKVEQYLLAVY